MGQASSQRTCLCVSAFLILTGSPLRADERANARLGEMKQLAQRLRAFRVTNQVPTPVGVSAEPLLRWSDPTRNNNDGSLWALGTSGRPLAIVALEFYPTHRLGEAWVHELVSLSTVPIEVDAGTGFESPGGSGTVSNEGGRFVWAPKTPGVVFRDIPDAAPPDATDAKRLRQIKELAGRFSADEYFAAVKQTYALRLSPHPIHRYHDQAAGIVDGAIFEIAHDTNPEVLLLIEAQATDPKTTAWRWAAAPLTTAEPTLRLDRKPVWYLPTPTRATPRETYVGIIKLRGEPTAGTPPKP